MNMSAYMVADEPINRVVEWLYFEVTKYQWLRDKFEKASGIDTTSFAWSEALGKAMFTLNVAGVNDRYGDGEAGKFRELTYHYQPAHGEGPRELDGRGRALSPLTELAV